MPEYIEREALIEEINSLQVSVTRLRAGKSVLGEYIKHYKDSIIKIINEQPNADVAEVEHAHWEYFFDIEEKARCSNCYEVLKRSKASCYCPHCGAMMDKEVKE